MSVLNVVVSRQRALRLSAGLMVAVIMGHKLSAVKTEKPRATAQSQATLYSYQSIVGVL